MASHPGLGWWVLLAAAIGLGIAFRLHLISHPIEVRLQNRGGFTHIYLSWTPPEGATEIIPPERLSPR